MDTASVSALAVVLGSLVGGSATVATAWFTQKTLRKHERIGEEIRQRETLFSEFIREGSKLVVDSFAHTLERAETLLAAYELINRIRLSASDEVRPGAIQDFGRTIPSFSIRACSVVRLMPKRRAAPAGPPITHWHSRSAFTIASRSVAWSVPSADG